MLVALISQKDKEVKSFWGGRGSFLEKKRGTAVTY